MNRIKYHMFIVLTRLFGTERGSGICLFIWRSWLWHFAFSPNGIHMAFTILGCIILQFSFTAGSWVLGAAVWVWAVRAHSVMRL